MLKIKLSRFGKRNQPHFRIVVNEARDKRDGSYVEMIGHYAPTQNPKVLELDIKKYEAWIAKGAQPTDTAAALYEIAKAGKGFPPKKKKPSKKQLAKKAAAAEDKKSEKEVKKETKGEETEVKKEKVAKKDEKTSETKEEKQPEADSETKEE
ncbi:MAG: 30S ribosomal protein S16 [Microgenomates bacterium 39_7]|nr:MAG: 30S ribosomal protein S16 [Microgenomates bacterium 39_7]